MNLQTRSQNFYSLPSYELEKRYEKVMHILAISGANVNAESAHEFKEDDYPLDKVMLQAQSRIHAARILAAARTHGVNIHDAGIYAARRIHAASNHAAKPKWYGSALQLASFAGTETMVRVLLDNGADIHAKGGSFETALQAAVERRKVEVVQLLLDRGSDVNAESRTYGSILQFACATADSNIVEVLLIYGADVNLSDGPYGGAFAAAQNRGDVVLCLLRKAKGVQVRQEDFLYIMEY